MVCNAAYTHGLCVYIDSVTAIWDLQFNASTEQQSRGILYANSLACYHLARKRDYWVVFVFLLTARFYSKQQGVVVQHTNHYTTNNSWKGIMDLYLGGVQTYVGSKTGTRTVLVKRMWTRRESTKRNKIAQYFTIFTATTG